MVGCLWKVSPPNFDVHAEIRADIEGWVYVNEFEAACVFDLAAERSGFERGKNELVVAPDELVGPTFELAAAGVEGEFLVVVFFFSGFVNMLQRLEGENGGANFAGFAVPSEFNFALVLEEDEPVSLRERLAGIDEFDQVALLGG